MSEIDDARSMVFDENHPKHADFVKENGRGPLNDWRDKVYQQAHGRESNLPVDPWEGVEQTDPQLQHMKARYQATHGTADETPTTRPAPAEAVDEMSVDEARESGEKLLREVWGSDFAAADQRARDGFSIMFPEQHLDELAALENDFAGIGNDVLIIQTVERLMRGLDCSAEIERIKQAYPGIDRDPRILRAVDRFNQG